jgi:hypothetical protein
MGGRGRSKCRAQGQVRTQGMGGGDGSRRTWLCTRSYPEDTFLASGPHPVLLCPSGQGSSPVRDSPTHIWSLAHAQPCATQGHSGPGR